MPHIYITDKTKEKIDKLVIDDNRTISKEVDFLCEERIKELNIRENANPSVQSQPNDDQENEDKSNLSVGDH